MGVLYFYVICNGNGNTYITKVRGSEESSLFSSDFPLDYCDIVVCCCDHLYIQSFMNAFIVGNVTCILTCGSFYDRPLWSFLTRLLLTQIFKITRPAFCECIFRAYVWSHMWKNALVFATRAEVGLLPLIIIFLLLSILCIWISNRLPWNGSWKFVFFDLWSSQFLFI